MSELKSRRNEFFRFISFIKPRAAGYIIGLVGSSLVGAGASLFSAYVIKDLLDAAIKRDISLLIRAVEIICLIVFTLCIFAPLFGYLFRSSVKYIMAEVRLKVLKHIEGIQTHYFEKTHSGEVISRITNDVQVMEGAFSDNLSNVMSICVSGISSAVLMFIFDWRIASILIFLGVISAIANILFAGPIRKISDNLRQNFGILTERLSDIINGFSIIKMFNIRDFILQKYDNANCKIAKYSMDCARVEAVQDGTNFLLGWLNFGGMMVVGSLMALYGGISFGKLAATLQLSNSVTFMFLQIGSFVAQLQGSLAGAGRVFELLDEPLELEKYNMAEPESSNAIVDDGYPMTEDGNSTLENMDAIMLNGNAVNNAGNAALENAGAIAENVNVTAENSNTIMNNDNTFTKNGNSMVEMRNVIFCYEKDKKILDGLTLSAGKGQITALVGPSGGGKSTIIKLLMGFYPPDAGCMSIDGRPLGYYTLKELRELTAYVPQDAYLFEGTIEENIRYGKLDADKGDIIEAAKAANAHSFILEQTDGYATMVGERGVKLSGGQRQRIAIARAVLKNAPILLLDEATSALDSESEHLVQQALDGLMEGRTTIAVAHRLSTIEHADMIYVVNEGKVLEKGTHKELSAGSGLYNRLYELQFQKQEVAAAGE